MEQDERTVIERPVRFGTARLVPDPRRPRGWTVTVDGVIQSYVDLNDPRYLGTLYLEWITRLIDLRFPAGEPISGIHVGGAACMLPRYVAAARPDSTQTVFELDGELVALVREHLGLDLVPGLDVRVLDGRAGVQRSPAGSADLVVLDAFRRGGIVTELATVEFLGELTRVLRPDGLYLANIWDSGELTFLRRAVAAVAEVWPHVVILGEDTVLFGQRPGNVVVGASARPIEAGEVTARDRTGVSMTARQLADWRGEVPPITEADRALIDVPEVSRRWSSGSVEPSASDSADYEDEA